MYDVFYMLSHFGIPRCCLRGKPACLHPKREKLVLQSVENYVSGSH